MLHKALGREQCIRCLRQAIFRLAIYRGASLVPIHHDHEIENYHVTLSFTSSAWRLEDTPLNSYAVNELFR
jgi:hypothetical protein